MVRAQRPAQREPAPVAAIALVLAQVLYHFGPQAGEHKARRRQKLQQLALQIAGSLFLCLNWFVFGK